MRLKTFHAPSVAEAMSQVRDALGDEAIIVSSRTEKGGAVRLTAAIDEDESMPAGFAPERAMREPPKPAQPSPFSMPGPEPDAGEELIEILLRHGTPAAITENFLSAAAPMAGTESSLESRLSAILGGVLSFSPLLPQKPSPRPIVLVGLPGSGKTLAAARLATQAVMAGLKPVVISADTVRAGGTEQLEAFTRLLNIPLTTIEDPEALEDAIAAHAAADLFIIDTPGINPFREDERAMIRKLLGLPGCDPLLVMPASGDPHEAVDCARTFMSLGAARILPTRLDIGRRFGSLLAAAQATRLPITIASASPKVTDRFIDMTPKYLAGLLAAGSTTEVKP